MTYHPLVARYMHRKGIPLDRLRSDGRLQLTMGERYRMQMQPLPGGRLLFEARIAPLATDAQRREQQVDRVLRAGAARLAGHAEHCAIDREAQSLVLQQRVDDDLSPVAFEEAVEQFLRALVFWKAVESQA